MSELRDLSENLCSVEDFLRDYPGRHGDDMADVVHEAWKIIDDLADDHQTADAWYASNCRMIIPAEDAIKDLMKVAFDAGRASKHKSDTSEKRTQSCRPATKSLSQHGPGY